MNSCILMAEIVQAPELRYTSDNQTPVTEMMVQFPGARPEDPPATLKVVGWGNLAQDIQEQYRLGDRVVIEGRLTMSTVDRPEGFKEKRAELTAQRVHRLEASALWDSTSASRIESVPAAAPTPNRSATVPVAAAKSTPNKAQPLPEPVAEVDYDDIPF